MNKTSTLAESIRNKSKLELQNTEQAIQQDLELLSKNIKNILNQELDIIKTDTQEIVSQSVIAVVAESLDTATESIKSLIQQIQETATKQISDQESQILKQFQAGIQAEAAKLQAITASMQNQVNTTLNTIDSKTQTIEEANQSAQQQIEKLDSILQAIQNAQQEFDSKINKIKSGVYMTEYSATKKLSDYLQLIELSTEHAYEATNKRTGEIQAQFNSRIESINKTIDNLQQAIVTKLYTKTYKPLIIIFYLLAFTLIVSFQSCTIKNNKDEISELNQQIASRQAMIAQLNSTINTATVAQATNLITIEKTYQGFLIKSKHPTLTDTIRHDGLLPTAKTRAILIKTQE